MVKTFEYLKYTLKIIADPECRQDQKERRALNRELERLSKLARFTPSQINFKGEELELLDPLTFLANYREMFEKNIYKFNSKCPDPYILDCGANVGLSVLYFKQLYPNSEIVAFEPDPNIFAKLARNVQSMNLKNVTLVPKAVWKEQTTLPFILEGGNSSRIANKSDSTTVDVETITLRSFINRHVDFLKIDIEGAEVDVLENCRDLLDHVERIFVEYHSVASQLQRLHDLLQILSSAGFSYYIDRTGVTSANPLSQIRVSSIGMDLQLNIFGYR